MADKRRTNRVALVVLVVVGAASCLALGYWQWTRFESVGGDGQNLGYAFQWPLFAAFFIYAYRRFVKLEDAQSDPEPDTDDEPREIPPDLLPPIPTATAETADQDDRARVEYNAYLEELAARDANRSNH
ncbi:transcriptional regulator [Rhodococcus rhodnii]|uniref:Lipoprotein LprD n=2 Tax=Rhodococcus rhodnii TaxID=38312 RepID=R7WIW4_9NOCA|nr:hypothetical protein [Rhodococcus rhodnii]EOM75176.1 hypothetical protein Rrhod_3511 [Rhodococcus rhodnii LMG 5362]TXG91605.1 transcriptional regulator [Rhodococcus rhodnii]